MENKDSETAKRLILSGLRKEMKEKMMDCFNHMKGHFLLIMASELEGVLKGNPKLSDRLRILIVDLENEARIRLNNII